MKGTNVGTAKFHIWNYYYPVPYWQSCWMCLRLPARQHSTVSWYTGSASTQHMR